MTYPKDDTEFGGGPGPIDRTARARRVLEPHQEMMELYATNPMNPKADPATADIERPDWPKPYPYPDKKTAEGTQ